MARLTGNTVVRHPDTGRSELLKSGSMLPDWAVGMVGDHLLDKPDVEPTQADAPPRQPRSKKN